MDAAIIEPDVQFSGSKRILFVGNSHTYQPKELGGVPGAVKRLALAASGSDIEVDSVTKGGADLVELWDEFEAKLSGDDSTCGGWDTFVLQITGGEDPNSRVAVSEVLQHRYAPLLQQKSSGCKVLLYQTWSGPQPRPREADILSETVEAYRASLVAAGVTNVSVARVGHAFLSIQAASDIDKLVYPALFKDDMGHGSALTGVLVAAVIVLTLGLGTRSDASKQRPLGRMLEAMLPSAWRTASTGYAGEEEFGKKGWRGESKGAVGSVMGLVNDPEEDLPINKYPPGMRTEKRDLGIGFGDALVFAATEALALESPADSPECAAASSSASPAPQAEPTKARRWNKK